MGMKGTREKGLVSNGMKLERSYENVLNLHLEYWQSLFQIVIF